MLYVGAAGGPKIILLESSSLIFYFAQEITQGGGERELDDSGLAYISCDETLAGFSKSTTPGEDSICWKADASTEKGR
jgi:hypothetical protein